MPRRTAASATPVPASSHVSFQNSSLLPSSDPTYTENLSTLRRHWKWAAFSQFFYTFAQLFSMPDVTLIDIEDDLAQSTTMFLPRIIVRLLYTLTQDRKINIDNWQVALRKQYLKRDPTANPLGVEPPPTSAKQSREPTASYDQDHEQKTDHTLADSVPDTTTAEGQSEKHEAVGDVVGEDHPSDVESERGITKEEEMDEMHIEEPQSEATDWLELPMLTKLDSLHLLTEWQFQNPHRFRQIMKDDDEVASWRIEPIGYDAKTNAYWLIGADRLWIQRVPPKPPKLAKRKRTAAKKVAVKASSSKTLFEQSESEEDTIPAKRTRPSRTSSKRPIHQQTVEVSATPGGRSIRTAKLQANKKLGAQAKELAEFQRQDNFLKRTEKSPTKSDRQTRSRSDQNSSKPLGTRVSARLRGTIKDEEQWQQIPDDWLKSEEEYDSDPGAAPPRTRRGASYVRGVTNSKGTAGVPVGDSDLSEEDGQAAAVKAGLMSGDDSELTELSDEEEKITNSEGQESLAVTEQLVAIPAASPQPPDPTHSAPTNVERPEEEESVSEAEDTTRLPADFVEWEAICVTLDEWDHIAERFGKATHYLEKALYKVLTHHVVPVVTAELREVEKKRKMEEAIVHRKRSSRIAVKETEKEEARLAAQRKAEDDEKMARQRRMEARAKKEEIERQKREQAREQRRLEREERERRVRDRQEREKSPATSAANDWVLDCEICHKSGINVDDGLPMVSCSRCGKWQHITCHDLADRKAGHPIRNWQQEQFYCQPCKSGHNNGLPNGTNSTQSQQRSKQHHTTVYDSFHQSTQDLRGHQQPYQSGTTYAQHQYAQGSIGTDTYPRVQRSGGLTFAHYQPEQRGFTTSRSTHVVPTAQPSWANGQLHIDGLDPRVHSPAQYVSQPLYSNNDMYMGNHTSSPYQDPNPNHAYTRAPPQGMSTLDSSVLNGNWAAASNGYHQSGTGHLGHLSAAESLAHLQNGGPGRQGWSQGPSNYMQPGATLLNPQMMQQQRMNNPSSYQYPQS